MPLDRELKSKGVLVQIDGEERTETIQKTLKENGYFTEIISRPDLLPERIELYLIGWEKGFVDAVAIGMVRGMPVSSGQRIRFNPVCNLPTTSADDVFPHSNAGKILRKAAEKTNAIRINNININKVLNSIVDLYPRLKEEIQAIVDDVNESDDLEEDEKTDNFSMQRDALGLSLEIFSDDKVRKKVLTRWTNDKYEESTCFLESLDQEYMREDVMIIQDMESFGDWIYDRKVSRHTRKFVDAHKSLYVTMANRTAIEQSLGVDLIYYKKEEDTFCFIQYKRLQKKGSHYVYYPDSDSNYKVEVKKMKEANTEVAKLKPPKSLTQK